MLSGPQDPDSPPKLLAGLFVRCHIFCTPPATQRAGNEVCGSGADLGALGRGEIFGGQVLLDSLMSGLGWFGLNAWFLQGVQGKLPLQPSHHESKPLTIGTLIVPFLLGSMVNTFCDLPQYRGRLGAHSPTSM